MKPKIKFDGYKWVVYCKRHLRSFDLFGADAEQRNYLQTLPQSFKTWEKALNWLCDLYRNRDIILR